MADKLGMPVGPGKPTIDLYEFASWLHDFLDECTARAVRAYFK